mmetsp:Transcript_5978/g.14683  ORF Transcript_5978/g.14683 Transcript_5978/m.14683 type:complete len:141 (+) Transcript_5978:206-628(+)
MSKPTMQGIMKRKNSSVRPTTAKRVRFVIQVELTGPAERLGESSEQHFMQNVEQLEHLAIVGSTTRDPVGNPSSRQGIEMECFHLPSAIVHHHRAVRGSQPPTDRWKSGVTVPYTLPALPARNVRCVNIIQRALECIGEN